MKSCHLNVRLGLALFAGIFAFERVGIADSGEPDPKLKSVYETVRSSVVRIEEHGDPGHMGVGVIVHRDGYVVTHAMPHAKGKSLEMILADGMRARGILLGWSAEWNVSLAKIMDEGHWPFVNMDSSAIPRDDSQPCFTVGYRMNQEGWDSMPEYQIGKVTDVGINVWFKTAFPQPKKDDRYFDYGPVFNIDGKMLGFTAVIPVGSPTSQLQSRQIQRMWHELSQPINLDKARLFEFHERKSASRPYSVQSEEVLSIKSARENVIASSVRIRTEKGSTWSGTVVSPDGYVVTCAHTPISPGQIVTLEFHDGRNEKATVKGTNPMTDIAVIKIVEKGTWSFAPLGETSHAKTGNRCWVAGYPSEQKEREPLVRDTSIAESPAPEWSFVLLTANSYTMYGGDSGGGVFDHQGRLLGITQGQNPGEVGRHSRIETVRYQWEVLALPVLEK
jgi:S1-C subfamily serine protease